MSAAPALAVMADFAAGLRARELPEALRAKVRTCLADAVWGCLQIHSDARAMAALRVFPIDAAGARAPILTTGHRAAAADAAFVNAAACAATDRSDTHVPTATHPGIIIIPAVLAALAESGGSGGDLVCGVVAGYEIMCRIARAVHSPSLSAIFRPTAIAAPVAAAIAVATALRLDRDTIVAAGALAAQTCIGFNQWAHAGTGEHVFHAGVAARNAVTSALLARAGATAAPTALDGASGLLAGFGARDRAAELTRGLGEVFEMPGIVFKPAPACFFVQTPVQLAARAAARVPDAGAITAIDIHVTQTAATYPGCAETRSVATPQAAVMSIAFGVSATLLAGRVDAAAWQDFTNPATTALMRRCTVHVDDALSRAFPLKCGTRLVVHLADGTAVDVTQEDFRSMDEAEVVARFIADAAPLIGRAGAEGVLDRIASLERLGDVVAITAAFAVTQGHAA